MYTIGQKILTVMFF